MPPLRSSACLAEGSEEVGYVGCEDGLLLHTEEEGELGVVGEGLGAEDVCVMLEEGGGGERIRGGREGGKEEEEEAKEEEEGEED